MFGFFRKRDDARLESKFNEFSINIKSSFINIKRDMDSVFEHIGKLNSEDSRLKQLFVNQTEKIMELQNKIDAIAYALEIKEEGEEKSKSILNIKPKEGSKAVADAIKELHGVSGDIFRSICALSIEKGEVVSYEDIAHELYPSKPYDSVRSTISEYISLLVDLNLITRRRRGKRALVSLSDATNPLLAHIRPRTKAVAAASRRRNKKV